MSSLKYLSLRTMLDIAQVDPSQDSRIASYRKKNSEIARLDQSRDRFD